MGEPRRWEVQALHYPSSSRPLRSRLNLHSLSRLFRQFNFKGANTCTTSSNRTDFTLPQQSLMCPTRCRQPSFYPPPPPIESPLQPFCTSTEFNIAYPISNCTVLDK